MSQGLEGDGGQQEEMVEAEEQFYMEMRPGVGHTPA
jgi:hypothetical protein